MLLSSESLHHLSNLIRAVDIASPGPLPKVRLGAPEAEVFERLYEETDEPLDTPILVTDRQDRVLGVSWLESFDSSVDKVLTPNLVEPVSICPGTASAMDLAMLMHEELTSYALIGSRAQPSLFVVPGSFWSPAFRLVLLGHLLRLESIWLEELMKDPLRSWEMLHPNKKSDLEERWYRSQRPKRGSESKPNTRELLDLTGFADRLELAERTEIGSDRLPQKRFASVVRKLRNKLAHPTEESLWSVLGSKHNIFEVIAEIRRLTD